MVPFDRAGVDMVARSRGGSTAIAAVAGRLGVAFLDAGPLVVFGPRDGVHLDAAAHEALTSAIGDAVTRLIERR